MGAARARGVRGERGSGRRRGGARRGGRDPAGPVLVRRLYDRPLALPPRSRHLRDDGWLSNSLPHGAVTRLVGPCVISGGWWRRSVHREYHFAETGRGDLLWVSFDRERRRWFLQGHVK